MRIRTIKPEFWRSKSISALEIGDRLLFIGLWSYVDDNGVGLDRLALVAADLFADDLERDFDAGSRETVARVSRGLQRLSEAHRIVRFSVAGTDYLYIVGWEEHQRIDKPGKSRYPLPTRDDAVIRVCLATVSRDYRETLAPGTGEQGNRGTGEKTSSSEIASDLDATGIDDNPRPEVLDLCEHLAESARANGHRVKIGKLWYRECRLLIDVDGYTPEQIRKAIDWATADPFWSANIQSMRKLREKYSTLRAQAQHRPTSPATPEPREPRYVPSYHDDADDMEAYNRWYAIDHTNPAVVAEYRSWYEARHKAAS